MTSTVGLLLGDGFSTMALAPLTAFELANRRLGRAHYAATAFSATGGGVRASFGLEVATEPLGAMPDTLLVAGGIAPRDTAPEVRDWLTRAADEVRRVAGVCTGAFALAEAGLLDGRSATTHWAHAARLRERFPKVRVEADRIFVRDGPVWTSAGMTAGIDLALALIEDDHGAELARQVARGLVVYHRRPGGQSQFSTLLELEPRSDRVRRALLHARENLTNPLSVEELAEVARLSPRQFSRVFREETGQTPAKAVEQLRLETARQLIEDRRLSMDEVARETGFGDRDRLRRAFLRAYRQSPQGLRRTLQLVYGEAA